jgi:hypothetical protein
MLSGCPNFRNSWQMKVRGQLHGPATLTLGKELPVPSGLKAGWAPEREGLDAMGEGKNLCPKWELNLDSLVDPIAWSPYDTTQQYPGHE